MNKEIHHEGWLIKSPPTKRILRARWRKRWFTLKQGEIPGQFCLEYYTDRNCRKLKGVIDLDQCEQVDSGLHLEHRKQKFQYMFDIKTPNRIYYLAAETETDMRDWVNCICQVCNLHDFTKQPGERQYYNLCEDTYESSHNSTSLCSDSLTDLATNAKNKSNQHQIFQQQQSNIPDLIRQTGNINLGTYHHNSDTHYVNTTLPLNEKHGTYSMDGKQISTLERTQSLRAKPTSSANDSKQDVGIINHNRSQSLIEQPITSSSQLSSSSKTIMSSTGVIKRIPENLVLSDTAIEGCLEPSPALSTCSGPYIPISECYSGTKFMCDDNPTTPLNNLDPKFYGTPRSDKQIGLNLMVSQSYSPKIYNCPQQNRPRSGRSSPTDSESVFTDDEDWAQSVSLRESTDRSARPSDSSIENEALVYSFKQRFSKMPDKTKTGANGNSASETHRENAIPPTKSTRKLASTNSCEDEKNRDIIQFSDTENTSPAIGPKDSSSCVEESYDIPRSHNLPYYNLNTLNQTSPSSCKDFIRSSTPNLNAEIDPVFSPISGKTLPRSHFYSNAAPTKTEGNVFRYDFIEQPNAPVVNRSLKPKVGWEGSTEDRSPLRPPSIDRKLKPALYKENAPSINSPSLRRSTNPRSLVMSSDTYFGYNHKDLETRTLPRNISTTRSMQLSNSHLRNSTTTLQNASKSNSSLQYLELDVSNPPPPRLKNANSISAVSGETSHSFSHSLDIPTRSAVPSGVEYKCVDFLKTEAFKRVKEDAEKNRMKD